MNPLDSIKDWLAIQKSSQKIAIASLKRASSDVPVDTVLEGSSSLEAITKIRDTTQNLDDATVVLYWSVFEQMVLDFVLHTIKATKQRISPFDKKFLEHVFKKARYINFEELLNLFKGKNVPSKKIGNVKQVYQYRNWIAHGKRGEQPPNITPDEAYLRLTEFLKYARIIDD